ncbi:MAG: ribokinase [Planctomycetaceae bacterium]|nr:MAG: ribokinase [Planctomycetaceae bacterium]
MSEIPNILVVGSLNMDLAVRTQQMPLPGQTVLGYNFKISPGGKGANQAVAAARLGAKSRMIGRVGADTFGEKLLSLMRADGVDTTDIMVTPEAVTGTASITVDSRGENYIIVAPGANYLVTPDDLFDRENIFAQADVLVLQLELPLPTVRAAIDLGKRHGCKIILDPAPAPAAICDELCNVDIITPNASEAEILTGKKPSNERTAKLIASELIARGAKTAVLKLGPHGSLVVMADGHFYTIPPVKVEVVDTTAAGDAFTAALAVAVARGENMHTAAKFANAAGALACTKFGAQSSMPHADDVNALLLQTS